MKTYKILIVAVVAMFALSSCQKFLTTQLMDKKTSENYYQTPDDAATALVGCYNGMDLMWNDGPALPLVAEVCSDDALGGTGSGDDYTYEMLDEFKKSIAPSGSVFENEWKQYYQAIYRCNTLIQRISQVKWGSDTTSRLSDEAQAKFIRAYLYYGLVRLFGHIPLVTTPTSANVKQASPDSVYAQIISDFKFAADNLPAKPYSATPSGEVTKWAAESMLARVYLFYSGYYGKSSIDGFTKSDALAAVEDVIKNGGYSLVPNFASLWPAAAEADTVAYAGENNPEVVFSIKYTGNADYNGNITGNTWLLMTGMRLGAGGGISIYPYGYGWGACTVDPKLYNAYSANDTRRFATITAVQEEGLDTKTAAQTGKPFSHANNREYTGYYLKKYSPLCDTNNSPLPTTNYLIAQKQDYFAIRYSDVLLMAAELGSPNALADFNEVHTRAGLPAVSSIDEAAIMHERRLEFAGEGIRYWDLLRQGINTAASTIVANTSMSYLDDGTGSPTISAQNIKLTGGFQQIPEDEITLSGGVLKQNPGW